MVGIQVHISTVASLAEKVAAVENDEMGHLRKKPYFGFWTSSWREETQDSDWIDWCRGENFGDPHKGYWFLLTPVLDCNLYVIDNYTDLERLISTYSYESPYYQEMQKAFGSRDASNYKAIDFERLSQEYDGLHLTERGNSRLHLSYPLDMNAWDSESTLWFKWCFTDVKRIEAVIPQEV